MAGLVERCCRLARRFADRMAVVDGVRVGHEVVLDQVLVRFGEDDGATDAVVAAAQASGECWMGSTTWRRTRYLRLSVANWSTVEEDIDRTPDVLEAAWRALR